MSKDAFVDRKYLIPALWALVTGVITSALFFWLGSGPQEVTVTNPTDTVLVENRDDRVVEPDAERVAEALQRLLNRRSSNGQLSSSPSSGSFNSIRFSQYELPSNVKGYTQKSLNGFASSSCPEGPISEDELIIANFNLLDEQIANSATPIFVRLTEIREGKRNLQRFEQQYKIRAGQNQIAIGSNFPSGRYRLAFGFYLENELQTEYPAYYASRCSFAIA